MSEPWIPYGRQLVDEDDIQAVVEVLRSDWLTTGPAVDRFEEALEERVGAPVVAVSSGTAALHAAYFAAGVGPGDEVITTPLTFVATAAAAMHLGATIRLVDVREDTLNIDPDLVAEAVTERTKVIAAVDYAGHPADLDDLAEIARSCGALLLEDASHSLGASYRGRPVGSIADLTTFSFHPVKLITTGEGGAVSARASELVQRVQSFRNHGLVRDENRFLLREHGPWHQEVHHTGLNYRMPDVLAALGTSQLGKLADFLIRRTAIAGRYLQDLADLEYLHLPAVNTDVAPAWHLFPIRVDSAIHTRLYEYLRNGGIGTQVHYLPLHMQPGLVSLGYSPGDFPVAEDAYRRLLSIPIHPSMSDGDCDRVVESIGDFSG